MCILLETINILCGRIYLMVQEEKKDDNSEELSELMKRLGRELAAKRWAGHKKQTAKEKRDKWNKYQREYRKKNKDGASKQVD